MLFSSSVSNHCNANKRVTHQRAANSVTSFQHHLLTVDLKTSNLSFEVMDTARKCSFTQLCCLVFTQQLLALFFKELDPVRFPILGRALD